MDERTKAIIIDFSNNCEYMNRKEIEGFIENIYNIGFLDGQVFVMKAAKFLGES